MCRIALKVPRGVVPVRRLAKRHNASFSRAEVFDDPLDRPILSGRITTLEYDQHLVAMLDDVFLNLDQLDLEIAQCRLVSRGPVLPTVCFRGLCHFGSRCFKTPLLTTVAGDLQQEDEQVEEIEIERKRAHDRLLASDGRIVIR
jgi:hypothetical protein